MLNLNSLRVRLTLLFVVLTVIPLIIAGTLIALQGFDALQNQAINLQEQVARQTSTNLEAFFHERENELRVLTDVYGLTLLDSEEQEDVLLTLLGDQPAYYELVMADASGQETIHLTRGSLIPSENLPSRADNPLFQAALETRTVNFSTVYFNEAARDQIITAAVPVEDLFTGEISHVLFAEIRFRTISETILRELRLAQTEDVYVATDEGLIIAHQNPSLILEETVFQLPSAKGRHTGLTGGDVVLAMDDVELENLRLVVVAETAYTSATALAFDLAQLAMAITGVTLVVAAIIVAWVVSRVVNPIIKLSHVAQAIQRGDFTMRTHLNRKDEIGQFAVAFNEMSDAIQKREADLRVATARAKEAARVKGEFLANVSHELRTPLNAIIGFSDMLLAGMSGPLNEKQAHKMGRLKENGLRLLALINDLLDLTRIESGRLEVVDKAFSPRAVAERITAQMESLAVESKLNFETKISPDVPELIYGDEKRVEQVMVNLLSNAFKFTESGSVTLNIEANHDDKTWTLEVVDTGIGIPPHAMNVIFEEFRQLDGSYSRAYKGSGLGLAITRNLVRMMGGKIGVKSTLDEGSTFTAVLPLSVHEMAEPLAFRAEAS